MSRVVSALLFCLASPAGAETLDADACARLALKRSAQIEEAAGKVREYEAVLAEVESIFYPKLNGIAYLAPMFTVTAPGGDIDLWERRWKSINDWGPYTHLEATLAQPLYTFGRAAAGETAARERAEVEKARLHETELSVALEVRRLYFTRLFALSMQPALKSAQKLIDEARKKGRAKFDANTGEVTQADLAKLDYAASEIAKYLRLAEDGAVLALAALKHTMGLPEEESLDLADSTLPAAAGEDPTDLAPLLLEAANQRPEWQQLTHGKAAAEALASAEARANLPVLFLAGVFTLDWAPTRFDSKNPYHYDNYNQIFGGAALGLKFDLDPALAAARTDKAEALGAQVDALHRFASTGIPLRVRKAHQEVLRGRKMVELSDAGVKAAQKWMTFSAAAYTTGTGEARDVLEGVGAYLQAKKGYYEALQGYYIARAELDFAVGR